MGDYSTLVQQLIKSGNYNTGQNQILRVLAAKLDAFENDTIKRMSEKESVSNSLQTSKNAITGNQSETVVGSSVATGVVGKTSLGKIQIYNSGRYWQSGNMWVSIDSNGFLFCVNGTVAARLEKTGNLYVNTKFSVCNGNIELARYIGEPNNPLIKMGKNDGGAIEMQCENSVLRATYTGMFQFRGRSDDEDAITRMLIDSGETRSLPNGIHVSPNVSDFPNGLSFVYDGKIIAYTHREEVETDVFVVRFDICGEIRTGVPFGYIDNSIAI